jgi:hypothetical protein
VWPDYGKSHQRASKSLGSLRERRQVGNIVCAG